MKNPLVSVIIPVYNREKSVHESIDSALAQTPQNFEVIVVDDGSTDKTAQVVTTSYGPPVRLIRKANGGVSSARNAGIQAALGKYVAFLDSDDLWLPGKLKAQADYLEAHPGAALVYTDEYVEVDGAIEKKTRFQKNPPKTRLLYSAFVDPTPLQTSSVMVRKSVLDEIGGFFEELKIHEDSDLWNRISECYELGFIDKPLTVYRWESQGDHLMNPKYRSTYVESGKKYLERYAERRKGRVLTAAERKTLQDSYEILARAEAGDIPRQELKAD